jgi:LPXTG-motif cell wall-anchored protein
MMMKKWMSTIVLTSTFLTFSGIASAHVTVWPKESKTNTYERYTIRVPVEKNSNTIKVRLEFPSGMKIGNVLPVPGWDYKLEKNTEGRFSAITWTATNGGIKPNEFQEFGLSGKNPKDPGALVWKAYQTYADGTTVDWIGNKDAKTPAPTITVKTDEKAGTVTTQNIQQTTASNTQAAPTGSNNTLPLALSGIAILLSIISFFRKKA